MNGAQGEDGPSTNDVIQRGASIPRVVNEHLEYVTSETCSAASRPLLVTRGYCGRGGPALSLNPPRGATRRHQAAPWLLPCLRVQAVCHARVPDGTFSRSAEWGVWSYAGSTGGDWRPYWSPLVPTALVLDPRPHQGAKLSQGSPQPTLFLPVLLVAVANPLNSIVRLKPGRWGVAARPASGQPGRSGASPKRCSRRAAKTSPPPAAGAGMHSAQLL